MPLLKRFPLLQKLASLYVWIAAFIFLRLDFIIYFKTKKQVPHQDYQLLLTNLEPLPSPIPFVSAGLISYLGNNYYFVQVKQSVFKIGSFPTKVLFCISAALITGQRHRRTCHDFLSCSKVDENSFSYIIALWRERDSALNYISLIICN